MFDYVRCRYPLPHHQDAQFQTKDSLRLVDHGEWLGGLLDHYKITKRGRLRRRMHKYKVIKTPRQFPSFYLRSIQSWWTEVSDAHWATAAISGSNSVFDSRMVAFKTCRIDRVRP